MAYVRRKVKIGLFFICVIFSFIYLISVYAKDDEEDNKKYPIIINGDKVEYSTDSKEFTATGNVEVIYKKTRLTCEHLTGDMATKDVRAEGRARMDDESGVIEGEKIIYNMQTKTGTIISAKFRANPYFGKGRTVDRVSENEFIVYRNRMTTCGYDVPHWHIRSRKVDFFPDDKVKMKQNTFYAGKIPMFYLPQYNHSLKDPLVHVQVMPGKYKEWGRYLLTAWRYQLSDNVTGRAYFDYRAKLGIAEGFGMNYKSADFGKGDIKYYYTQERSRWFLEGVPAEFQRYFIRWRHQWSIAPSTYLTSEYFKIVDSKRMLHGSGYNLLREYFYREYEKDPLPLSYVTIHHGFDYGSLDFLIQKRINRWYSQAEMLPEIKYSLPSLQIAQSPLYFQNDSSYVNYNYKSSVPSESWNDTTYNSYSTTNKISLPSKIAFFSLTPFISGQQAVTDKNSTYGSTLVMNFSTGSDLSTKFYRMFNIKTNYLGLDINGLRHVITPSTSYSFSHTSTMPTSEARIGGSASTAGSSATFELSNKLQTKRKNTKVDILDFRVNNSYSFRSSSNKRGGRFSDDFLFYLDLIPYDWLTASMDATYNHPQDCFTSVNSDINFRFSEERTLSLGHRYQFKGGKELTFDIDWRLTPKWKLGVYERYQIASTSGYIKGLREQEYFISRDLHCWTVEWNYNVTRDKGESFWLIFRLKAFPEMEFNYNQSYHGLKKGKNYDFPQ